MIKEIFCICLLIACVSSFPAPKPQDPAAAGMLVVMKGMDIVENGAAANHEHEMEFMGAKMGHKTGAGFGEAAQRQRRALNTEQNSGMGKHRRMRHAKDSSSSSSSSSSDSDE